jgi:hypothetical protein
MAHLPSVKSGIATGAPWRSIEVRDNARSELQVALAVVDIAARGEIRLAENAQRIMFKIISVSRP